MNRNKDIKIYDRLPEGSLLQVPMRKPYKGKWVKLKNTTEHMVDGVPPGQIGFLPERVLRSAAFRAGHLTADLEYRMPKPAGKIGEMPLEQILELVNRATSYETLDIIAEQDNRKQVKDAITQRAKLLDNEERKEARLKEDTSAASSEEVVVAPGSGAASG